MIGVAITSIVDLNLKIKFTFTLVLFHIERYYMYKILLPNSFVWNITRKYSAIICRFIAR